MRQVKVRCGKGPVKVAKGTKIILPADVWAAFRDLRDESVEVFRVASRHGRLFTMGINPKAIELTSEQQQRLADLADRSGQSWEEVFSEALSAYRPRNGGQLSASGRSFYDVMMEDGAIGVIKDGLPRDLSTNPQHMEGFGRDHEAGSG